MLDMAYDGRAYVSRMPNSGKAAAAAERVCRRTRRLTRISHATNSLPPSFRNGTPLVNIAWALNMTVAGIVAHQSALKDGELMKIPQYKL